MGQNPGHMVSCAMNNRVSGDPVLSRFRAALAETYGDRLERAVLFGSRARGDARPDSDYDVRSSFENRIVGLMRRSVLRISARKF